MCSIDEVVKRIAVANAEIKRINEERSINIGKKETLTKQLDSAIQKYTNDYGVSITVDNIDNEVSRVLEAKENEVKNIEAVLNFIKTGNYAEAEKLVGGTPEVTQEQVSEPVTSEHVETPVTTPPVASEPVEAPAAPPVTSEPVVEATSAPHVVQTPVTQPVSEPVTPEPATPPVQAPITPPVNTSGIPALDGFSQPASPFNGVSQPTAPVQPTAPTQPTAPVGEIPNVTSFQAILGGSNFSI